MARTTTSSVRRVPIAPCSVQCLPSTSSVYTSPEAIADGAHAEFGAHRFPPPLAHRPRERPVRQDGFDRGRPDAGTAGSVTMPQRVRSTSGASPQSSETTTGKPTDIASSTDIGYGSRTDGEHINAGCGHASGNRSGSQRALPGDAGIAPDRCPQRSTFPLVGADQREAGVDTGVEQCLRHLDERDRAFARMHAGGEENLRRSGTVLHSRGSRAHRCRAARAAIAPSATATELFALLRRSGRTRLPRRAAAFRVQTASSGRGERMA